MSEEKKPFIINQLEEALEERQSADRRKQSTATLLEGQEERRAADRRKSQKQN